MGFLFVMNVFAHVDSVKTDILVSILNDQRMSKVNISRSLTVKNKSSPWISVPPLPSCLVHRGESNPLVGSIVVKGHQFTQPKLLHLVVQAEKHPRHVGRLGAVGGRVFLDVEPHRYCFMLYEQPADFDIKKHAPADGKNVGNWARTRYDLGAFEKKIKLGPVIAANYFRNS